MFNFILPSNLLILFCSEVIMGKFFYVIYRGQLGKCASHNFKQSHFQVLYNEGRICFMKVAYTAVIKF
jgi:hypothetical protein